MQPRRLGTPLLGAFGLIHFLTASGFTRAFQNPTRLSRSLRLASTRRTDVDRASTEEGSTSWSDDRRSKYDGVDRRFFLWFGAAPLVAASPSVAIDFGSMFKSNDSSGSANANANASPEPIINPALTVNSNGVPQQQSRVGGLANRIRGICRNMDELQRDLMQERWDLVEKYPPQLRSYVPIFTTYTDAAFPSEAPSDYGLRVALRYEVGRFFASLERLKRATARKALDEAYVAYADMSLHLDRYLRVGGLYTYYDSVIDNEVLFDGYNNALVYADPSKDPAEVRDLIVLCKGPDKGKTGIVIGVYLDDSNNCVVKLDKVKGMREIRVVPRTWAAKRLGEQDPDDVFLLPRYNAKSIPL